MSGGVIVAVIQHFLEKNRERHLKESELKERRYKCILLLMYAYINSEELNSLNKIRPELKTKTDLERELQTEWVNSWLFAADKTVEGFKEFMKSPK